ncbi:MAG: hypothetical protein AB1Z67_10985 [Candidatus Limnocylindrales bacterium]
MMVPPTGRTKVATESAAAIGTRTHDLAAYLGLSALALTPTLVAGQATGAAFGRYFGVLHPAHVVIGATAVGGIALGWLRTRFGFRVVRGRATVGGVVVAAALATGLAASVVVADVLLGYPQGMNVPLPEALAFYPAVGYVAELLFHVLPLAVVLAVLLPARTRLGKEPMAWLAIALVAALEPTFHVLSDGDLLSPLAGYTWIHVYVFSLLQLALFRRYDFVSMVAMRLVYYGYWHVLWGTLRLDVLF